MPFRKAPAPAPQRFQVAGDLVNLKRLNEGGKVGLLMFKAGPRAEANEQLDRVSLMLIKGIRESLDRRRTPLTITTDQAQADLVLQGYVEEFSRPGKFDRWVKRRDKGRLSVSGEVWQQESGTKVLTFASSDDISKTENALDVAYKMGRAIGDFICAQAVKEPA